MNLLFYFLAILIVFFSTLICCNKKDIWNIVITSIAIGGVVNANFFHAGNTPINIFGINFGVDAIIYSIFVYVVMLKYIYWGKKDAYIMTLSGAFAVIFAALVALVAQGLSHETTIDWTNFLSFLFSTLATIAAGLISIEIVGLFKKLLNLNKYAVLIIGMLLITFINSTLFYGLSPLINGSNDKILMLTSFIGKIASLAVAIGVFALTNHFNPAPKTIEQKEENKN